MSRTGGRRGVCSVEPGLTPGALIHRVTGDEQGPHGPVTQGIRRLPHGRGDVAADAGDRIPVITAQRRVAARVALLAGTPGRVPALLRRKSPISGTNLRKNEQFGKQSAGLPRQQTG